MLQDLSRTRLRNLAKCLLPPATGSDRGPQPVPRRASVQHRKARPRRSSTRLPPAHYEAQTRNGFRKRRRFTKRQRADANKKLHVARLPSIFHRATAWLLRLVAPSPLQLHEHDEHEPYSRQTSPPVQVYSHAFTYEQQQCCGEWRFRSCRHVRRRQHWPVPMCWWVARNPTLLGREVTFVQMMWKRIKRILLLSLHSAVLQCASLQL